MAAADPVSTSIQNPYSGSGGTAVYTGVFGDGTDGAVTLDGSTDYTSAGFGAPSGNVYTMTRHTFTTSLTINNGVTLQPNGFPFFCTGTVRINSGGTIRNIGLNASGANGAATTAQNFLVPGSNGGNGATGAGQAGGQLGSPLSVGGSGAGGNGGAGGTGAGGSGGVGQAVIGQLRVPGALLSGVAATTNTHYVGPGCGGGGGGGDGTNSGGGGGGGGGWVAIWAHSMINNGTISVQGGNGANGTGGNSGGGGGGGGGDIIAYTLSAWTQGTMTVTGGTHGTGTGTGVNGQDGIAGVTLNVILL